MYQDFFKTLLNFLSAFFASAHSTAQKAGEKGKSLSERTGIF